MGDPELPEGEKKRRHARAAFGIFEDLFRWFFGGRDEHMEQGRYHVCLRCLLVVCGTLAGFAILFSAGSALSKNRLRSEGPFMAMSGSKRRDRAATA